MSAASQPDLQVFEEKIINHGKWNIIPVDLLKTRDEKLVAHQLNCLGSLFYFSKVALRNRRLSPDFHLDLCESIEREHLKLVIEVPRDHFKSTIYSESAPIWWALPFTARHEAFMRQLGYDDLWITWMKRAHSQDTRTLLVSENITNAAKLGVRIDGHYDNNIFFRELFPEITPGTGQSWTQFSKTHKRSATSKPHGEGTYDYIGVGGALQSRHYDRVVQDDLVGKAAVESDAIMQKTIDYHKLMVGAFDSVPGQELDNDEIVVGNRWSWKDLNSWIKENEPYFQFINHSALGGCCKLHPAGVPIFPEEFTKEKLDRFAKRLGPYLFSCQFLNKPIPPKGLDFDPNKLCYYNWRRDLESRKIYLRHEVNVGEVIHDLPVNDLKIAMIVDPNHSGNFGRCNHAIGVFGIYKDFPRATRDSEGKVKTVNIDHLYILDYWAETASYDDLIANIYKMASKWKLRKFWLETIAAQQYLKYHLDYRNRIEQRYLKVEELKTAKTKDAKEKRIDALGILLEGGQLFALRNMHQFVQELSLYPNGKTIDLLDILGYFPQVVPLLGGSNKDMDDYLNNNQPTVGSGPCGY